MQRIRETRRAGFGEPSNTVKSRVRDIKDKDPVPEGAEVVDGSTPLTDWADVAPAPVATDTTAEGNN